MSTNGTTPLSPASTTAKLVDAACAVIDPAKLPDDTTVLKQMIAELLTALKRNRRELAEALQRIDALLHRGRRQESVDPNQPLLFPEWTQVEPAAPPPSPA